MNPKTENTWELVRWSSWLPALAPIEVVVSKVDPHVSLLLSGWHDSPLMTLGVN